MYWDTIGGEKCEINLDPHLSLRTRHSYLDSDTPRLLAYPYLRQMREMYHHSTLKEAASKLEMEKVEDLE